MYKEWDDIPREHKISKYWIAIPKDADSILDGMDYEIVYVYFNGKFGVYRPGIEKLFKTSDFTFYHKEK